MKLERRQFIGGSAIALSALAAPAVWTGSRAQNKFVAKLSSASPPDHFTVRGLFRFAELVNDRTGGAVDIQVFPSNQLGGDVQVLENMKLGSVEASCVATSLFVQYVPEFSAVDLPFVFRDSRHAQNAGPVILDSLADKLDAAGYRPVGSFCYGSRDIISTTPITTLGDLEGKKIRVIESPTIVRAWQLLGANPTPLPAPEIYLALQTKLVDGLENPASNYLSFKWYEVAKHFSKLGYLNTIMLITFSESWFSRLPAEHVETINAVAAEVMPQIFASSQAEDAAALETTTKAGCTVHEVTDRDAWVEATKPIIEEFIARVPGGTGLLEQIRATS